MSILLASVHDQHVIARGVFSFAAPQEEGNYKLAHSKLFTTVSQLVSLGASQPQDLLRPLELLHSYILVKSLVGMNNHEGAARMLARVAGSISRWGGVGWVGGCVEKNQAGTAAGHSHLSTYLHDIPVPPSCHAQLHLPTDPSQLPHHGPCPTSC
jgi:hypothetical protein